MLLVIALASSNADAQFLRDLKNVANEKARSLATKENLNKATSSLLKNMEKARAEFDSTDFDYAILISDNAGLFDVQEKGERLAKASSLINLGTAYYNNTEFTDEERARFQRESGELAYGSGNFAVAEKRFNAAKNIYEEANLTEDLGYLKTISNQGLLYATMGRYTQAEGFISGALDIRKEKFGGGNIAMASSLNNYGVLHYNLGRYNEAEKTLASALSIVAANRLTASMPYSIILNNQAMLFQAIGRFEEAEKSLVDAISVAEKLESKKSKNHLKFLSNLALLYQQMGKYPQAEAIYLGMEKRLGKTNPDYASMLSNQAALYMLMDKQDKVENLLKTAAGIYKNSFGEENPAYAKVICDLANFYRMNARYSDALPLLEKALAIREKTLGKNHPHYVQSQEDLAILHWKNQSPDKAYALYQDLMASSLEFINRYFPPMSEAEKTKYWDVLSPRFQRFYNFAIDASPAIPALVKDLFDYQIATKALLLNSTNKVKQSIFNSRDGLLIKDYITWVDQKEQLARLYAYSKSELKQQKINLDSIERAANTMEKSLSERSRDFSEGFTSAKISYQNVRDLLTDSEAVVEIIRVRNFDQVFTGDSRYLALIIKKGAAMPAMKVLDNGQQLETRYAKYYRNAIQQKVQDDYSYEQYWSRIEPELAGKKVVYLSPDGVYNQINLNTLKKTGADYFINRYDLTILGNSKDLIALKSRKATAPSKNATLLGFPDYGGQAISALPGTKVEIDGIASILKASGYKLNVLTQASATETNLKSVKSPEVLHIATHGYFLQDVESTGSAFGVELENASDNPLLRSGLMLAGAAKTLSGATAPNLSSNDNGILTAYEAMNMDLEGTQLIVLSACETGLGDVKAGEGVYGLQRAFVVAGADALIMSLWKVDDAATQQLMKSFYANWIKLRNKQKAFKQAQLQLMLKYKEPYYWGAFVMMGQ
ncbi:MAG: CHAT domain-containing protein [Bacteroidota bacterium]|nr:CHAT domain-containing protein [Bacteroidota bacterium]